MIKEYDKILFRLTDILTKLSKTLQEPANNAEHQFPIIRNIGQDTNIKQVGR